MSPKRFALAAATILLCSAALLPQEVHAAQAEPLPRLPSMDEVATSPLADAAMRRDMAAVRAMLIAEEALDVDALGRNGTAALHWAARYGDLETVDWLLGAGADPDLPNLYGATPLLVALENGHYALARRLLEAGADPEAPDLAGEPPLFLASRLGDLAAVDLLLEHGAGVDSRDREYGQTALMIGVREGHEAITRRLLAAGADVDAQSRRSETVPGMDERFLPPSTIPGTLTAGVGVIRGGWPERGIRQPLAGAKTPLLFATRLGDFELTRLLVEAGADLELADANGVTPLLNAILNTSILTVSPGTGEHLRVARYLVEAGADVRAEDWYGQTPLFAAIDMRNLIYRNVRATENHVDREQAFALIELLLAEGADPNVRVREFPPARHFILGIGSVEWVDMTGQTAFLRAAQSGDVRVMRALLAHGADANIATYGGTTALMAAAGVNWAMGQTYTEAPESLLEAVQLAHAMGNQVNAVNSMGLQAVHGAAYRGSNDIISWLAAEGAELDRPDNEGRTPRRWAEGEYLPSRPLINRPETIALIDRLLLERRQAAAN